MHPFLHLPFGLTLPVYGLAIAAGFLAALILAPRLAERRTLSAERILGLYFWIVVSALGGSRVLYVLTNLDAFVELCRARDVAAPRSALDVLADCTRPLHFWDGGYVFLGGFLAAALVSLVYARRHRLAFLRVADLAVPLVALGHVCGRLGCLAAGCCYGKPSTGRLALAFPRQSFAHQELSALGLLSASAPLTPRLHPTQLYEAAALLVIFFVLLYLSPRQRFHGQSLLTYLLLYGPTRFVIELFRADRGRRYLLRLETPRLNLALGLPAALPSLFSTSQAISLLLAAIALGAWIPLARRAARFVAGSSRPAPSSPVA